MSLENYIRSAPIAYFALESSRITPRHVVAGDELTVREASTPGQQDTALVTWRVGKQQKRRRRNEDSIAEGNDDGEEGRRCGGTVPHRFANDGRNAVLLEAVKVLFGDDVREEAERVELTIDTSTGGVTSKGR